MNFLTLVRPRTFILQSRAARSVIDQCWKASPCSIAVSLLKSPGASAYIHGNYRRLSSLRSSRKTGFAKPRDSAFDVSEVSYTRSGLRYCGYQQIGMDEMMTCCKRNVRNDIINRMHGIPIIPFVFSQHAQTQRQKLCKFGFTNRGYSRYTFDNIQSFIIQGKTCFNFVRSFGGIHLQFAKGCHTRDAVRKNGVPEDEEDVEEWIHPDDRSDSILNKDPELKSLLRELASDFGEKNSVENKTDDNAVKKADDHQDHQDNMAVDRMKGDSEMQAINREEVETLEPIKTERGKEHKRKFVFSVDDLVSILREENAQDICVINIQKEKQYVDYFVVVTGRSPRHLKAIALHINQKYKSRKMKEDPYVLVEGEDTDDWICIDFGNIVLHVMSEETREFYELEKLWTLGPEYDDQLRRLKEHEIKIKETSESINLTRMDMEEGQDEDGDTKPFSIIH